MLLEVEIRSANARNDVYELRNFLQNESGLQIHIKEQPPQPGAMSLALLEPVIAGVVEAVVGHSISEVYQKMVKPKIASWMHSKKNDGNLEVLSTIKDDDGTRIHFLEDNKGRTEVFENLKYAIDVDHTRAVLIGNSEFDGSFTPIPPVKGNIEDLYHLLTDKIHVGLPPENVVVVFNKTNTEIEETLLQQSRIPNTETLIIYFAGHGHRTDVKKLYLVAKNSKRIDDYLIGGIDFDFISNVVLKNATAKQKILILDACHSGIATQGTEDMLNKVNVRGSYVLASSPGDEVSYFEKDGRNTYFTGVLLDALKQGVDSTNEMIALEDIYDYSKEQLSEKNFPHPIYKNELNIPASNFFIARNPSFSFDKLKQRPERLLKQGRFEEALYEYRLLLQRYPEDTELRTKASECETNALFNRLVQDGDELFYHVKDYAKAIDKYRKALQVKDDILVTGKLNRCQDYLSDAPKEEKKELKKISVIEEEKKTEKKVVPPLPKKEIKNEDSIVNEDKSKKEGNDFQLSINNRTLGIVLVSVWILVSIIIMVNIFNGSENDYLASSKTGTFLVSLAGIVLLGIRWKNISVLEMLLYAHGFFFCLLPLMSAYVDTQEHTKNGLLLFTAFDICYLALLIKKLKEFKLAEMIAASVEVFYLCGLYVSMLLYVIFRSNLQSGTELLLAAIAGIAGIVWMRKRWREVRKT